MKITFEASKNELVAASEIMKLWDRCTIGWVKPATEHEAERLSKVDKLNATMYISETYMDDLVKLLNKYSVELVTLIRGAISLAQGVKGLVSSKFKEDFKSVMDENVPIVKADYTRCKPTDDTTDIYDDEYAA